MIIKNMSKREKRIALVTVIFVTVMVLYGLIVDPVIKQWQILNDEIMSKTAALKHDITMLGSRKSIEANYSKFSKYVKSDKSEEETIADVLTYLENLSRSDSCLILNIKPIGTKDFGAYKELIVDLSADASVNQFMKFIYDIETSKNMILKIRHLSLTSKSGQTGALRGTFLISKVIIE